MADAAAGSSTADNSNNLVFSEAQRLFDLGNYEDAPLFFWNAIMNHSTGGATYTLSDAFQQFMACYKNLDRVADGYVFIADQYSSRSSYKEAKMYAKAALSEDPAHQEAQDILSLAEQELHGGPTTIRDANVGDDEDYHDRSNTPRTAPATSNNGHNDDASNKMPDTPESLYAEASEFFANKQMILSAQKNQESCDLSQQKLNPACANAAYCRSNVADWGPNGETYEQDMAMLERITRQEIKRNRYVDYDENSTHDTPTVKWSSSCSVHPHMMLGYTINNGIMKRRVAESYAMTDVFYGMAEVAPDNWREKLVGYPLDQTTTKADKYRRDTQKPGFKIKIGYLGVGFNSKAVLFLAQDVFRFHNKTRFETHALSTGSPDHPRFIEQTMRGVDWRKRVQENVDYFHDLQSVRKQGPTAMADYIANLGIHILMDWDGYARQGERAQGLYYLRPAPIQIMHQEFLGTHGGGFDYLITDPIVSPQQYEDHYSEKFIYMPNHFFCKGHRMQQDVIPPRYEYGERSKSPQQNKCGVNNDYLEVDFVYCNFNKFLKFNPVSFRAWLNIMERVPNSQLCLLGYPDEGTPYLLNFVNDYNPNLIDRVVFLEWENNPFDHQQRNFDYCNAVLDSHPYNSHTTGMDALYAGVPIVTRSDGVEMGSRVITSANRVLGVPELNAVDGLQQYEDIAVRLGTDHGFYKKVRDKLVASALQKDPRMHRFWDMERYTKNLERGLESAWKRYLNGQDPDHIFVEDVYGGDDSSNENNGIQLDEL